MEKNTNRRKELGVLLGEEMLEKAVEISIILLLTHHSLEGPPHPVFVTRVSWKRCVSLMSSSALALLLRFLQPQQEGSRTGDEVLHLIFRKAKGRAWSVRSEGERWGSTKMG